MTDFLFMNTKWYGYDNLFPPEAIAYIKAGLEKVRCHRCRKPAPYEDRPVIVSKGVNAGGDVYHQKCLPPILFKAMSGSRPDGQATNQSVPQQ